MLHFLLKLLCCLGVILMKLIITEIRQKSFIEAFTFDRMVDVSELKLLNNDIREIDSVQVKGMCTVDQDELIFTFTIEGMMVLPCARTLVDVEYPFKFNATEVFTTAQNVSDEVVDDNVHEVIGDVLDLTPFIKENIILESPLRVFSDEKPLEEGDGWTYLTEEELKAEEAEKIDPRLEKLKELFNKDNDETNK